MRRAAWSLSLCLWALPAVALGDEGQAQEKAAKEAEHEEHHGPLHARDVFRADNYSFWASVINFALLIALLRKLGKKPLHEFLVNRRKEMEQAMNEAAAAKQKAEARVKEYNERLATLDQELEKLRLDLERAAEEDKRRIVAEAEETARRLRRETESLIDQYQRGLVNAVRREMVDVAVSTAEARLREVLTEGDQQRLVQSFTRELEGERKEPRAPQSLPPASRAEGQP